jgi:hypothetical protein
MAYPSVCLPTYLPTRLPAPTLPLQSLTMTRVLFQADLFLKLGSLSCVVESGFGGRPEVCWGCFRLYTFKIKLTQPGFSKLPTLTLKVKDK